MNIRDGFVVVVGIRMMARLFRLIFGVFFLDDRFVEIIEEV